MHTLHVSTYNLNREEGHNEVKNVSFFGKAKAFDKSRQEGMLGMLVV